MTLKNRIAILADLPQLADLRWRLRVDDQPVSDEEAYDRFVADFIRICSTEWQSNEISHWITTDGERVLAIMSIVIVRKLPCPENLHGRWGYISNSYVLPEARDLGVGQRLLSAIKNWAEENELELLVVWPSERAYPFYERAGFTRRADPLVLKLRSD
jgi:ribosomal protein S18 acetylase RimI-like enzyme